MPVRLTPPLARRLAFALCAGLLLVGVTALAMRGLSDVEDRLHEIAQVNNQQQRCAIEMREHVDQVAAATRDLVLEDDLARMRPISDRIAAESMAYDAAETTLGLLLAGDAGAWPQERALFSEAASDKAAAWPLLSRVIALGTDNRDADATRLFTAQAKPALERWHGALTQLADLQERQNQAAAQAAQASGARVIALLAVVCALALVLCALAAWALGARASRAREAAGGVHWPV